MARPKIATDKILAAALRTFVEKGYHGATITDICKEVGCPVGSIYYRFKGKQEIAAELYKSVVEAFQKDLVDLAALGVGEPAQGVQACVGLLLDYVDRNPDQAKFLLLLRHRDFLDPSEPDYDNGRNLMLANEKVMRWSQELHQRLRQRVGEDAPAFDVMLALVYDAPLGYAKRWLHGQTRARPQEVRSDLIRAVLGGLGLGA